MGNSSGASRTHHRVIMQTCFIFHPSTRLLTYPHSLSFLPSSSPSSSRHLLLCCLFTVVNSRISLYPVSSNSSSDDNNSDNSEQHKICLSTIQSSLAVFARRFQYRRHLFLNHQDMTFDQQTRRSPAAVAWGQQVWKL